MKDINMEKNEKKKMKKFNDLFTGREEIIKNAPKNFKYFHDSTQELAKSIHPDQMKAVVSKIVEENPNVKTFTLNRLDQETFPIYKSGSYITLEVLFDNRRYKRAYSISSNSNSLKEIQITIRKTGKISNYMFHECKEGDEFTLYGPFGHFHYNPVMDSSHVVFLASGIGITSIKPMIEEILMNKSASTVELLYQEKTYHDLLWKEKWEELEKKYHHFHVSYILSEEKRENCSYGWIDEEKIRSLEPKNKSFFLSGPVKMYHAMNDIFKKLDIPNKYIRHEIYTDKPENLEAKEYQLMIHTNEKTITIPCFGNKTLIQSMEEGHVDPFVHCTVGVCGFCKSKLLSGTVKTENSSMRKKDIECKYIHPCVTYPLSDIEIELPF